MLTNTTKIRWDTLLIGFLIIYKQESWAWQDFLNSVKIYTIDLKNIFQLNVIRFENLGLVNQSNECVEKINYGWYMMI